MTGGTRSTSAQAVFDSSQCRQIPISEPISQRIAAIVNVTEGSELCPLLTISPFRDLLDAKSPKHKALTQALMKSTNDYFAWSHETYSNGKKASYKQIEVLLQHFAAGIQFSWESAPWGDPVAVHLNMPRPQDNQPAGIDISKLPPTLFMNVSLSAKLIGGHEATMKMATQRFGEAFNLSFEHQAFLAGMEEGRHLSQLLTTELQEVKQEEISYRKASRQQPTAQTPIDPNTAEGQEALARYLDSPFEKEATDFIRSHEVEALERLDQISSAGKSSGRGYR